MNVYDFDQTIYYPDSSYHFFLYCLKKYPFIVLPVIPGSLRLLYKYRKGSIYAKPLKEQLFSFLRKIPDAEEEAELFWLDHIRNISAWYLSQKKDDDLIISASPAFLLRPAAKLLGVRLIATEMDPHTGQIHGENCHDEEKVRRFRREYPAESIERFYSDSLSDSPLAELAEESFLVRKDQIIPWPDSGNKKR